jgi:hypothetical protein
MIALKVDVNFRDSFELLFQVELLLEFMKVIIEIVYEVHIILALELRDNDKSMFLGKGVSKVISLVIQDLTFTRPFKTLMKLLHRKSLEKMSPNR